MEIGIVSSLLGGAGGGEGMYSSTRTGFGRYLFIIVESVVLCSSRRRCVYLC